MSSQKEISASNHQFSDAFAVSFRESQKSRFLQPWHHFSMHHFSTLKNYPTKNAACLMHPQEWVPCKDVQFSTLRITSSRVRQVCPAEQTRIALGGHHETRRDVQKTSDFASFPVILLLKSGVKTSWGWLVIPSFAWFYDHPRWFPTFFQQAEQPMSILPQGKKRDGFWPSRKLSKRNSVKDFFQLCRCFQKSPFENLPKSALLGVFFSECWHVFVDFRNGFAFFTNILT